MSEYTKGWRVDGDLIREETAIIVACRHRTPKALWAEHARIMAAAPELLEALKEAEKFVDRHSESWYTTGQELLTKMRAVIAKAEGK